MRLSLPRVAWLASLALVSACGRPSRAPEAERLDVVRATGRAGDAEATGAWLLAELLVPGGGTSELSEARSRLAARPARGLMASLARAIDADVHGRWPEAFDAYLATVEAARASSRSEAPLLAWYAVGRAEGLRSSVADGWKKAEPVVASAIAAPGNVGWRSRGMLVEWRARETAQATGRGPEGASLEELADAQGCVKVARFAGPFGHRQPGDARVHFAAEGPTPWPLRFDADTEGRPAESSDAFHRACALTAKSRRGDGVYYVQTFIELDADREAIVAVSGAFSVRVDDTEVLARDEAEWGSWTRLGAAVKLRRGRHRIVARVARPETAIHVLAPDGRPLPVVATAADDLPYELTPPTVLADPNPLEPFLRALGVRGSSPTPNVDVTSPALRYVAAAVAAGEGHRDLASVLALPLVEPANASPVALSQAAAFAEEDPVFSRENARSLARDLHGRALDADKDLWGSALWLVLDRAAQARPADTALELAALSDRFPRVPTIAAELAAIEAQLGWTVEHARTLEVLAARFPEDVRILEALLAVAERQGKADEVTRLQARITSLAPSNELAFRRALARWDFVTALAELRRIEALHGDRRDLPFRIAELLARAGKSREVGAERLRKLELALEREPHNPAARLALADARHAGGERHALEDALVDAIRTGSDTSALHQAIELVDGTTALEPYRKDGLAILREAEAKGISLPGSAARLLDYAALWIHADGSARMLEHTVLRVQSREGIERYTEQRLPQGVILKLRTIKKDGRIFEPEIVPGKPTVTMPHLEVGDVIETENIWVLEGDGEGRRFRGPRWFFREPNVSYHLSQLVVISPNSRPLVIETSGNVPAPEVSATEGLEVRRWTVTGALALPEENGAPPIEEFLPSVLVGWGADWMSQLERVASSREGGRPRDPRLVRIARTIATGSIDGDLEAVTQDERARRIYRWVVDNVTPGKERWPARIVTSKNGDLTEAFLFLCQLVGVDARLAVVKNRLAPPSRGPLSDIEAFASTAVRVSGERGPTWLAVGARYAPYGFMPSALAGQPAVLLDRAELPTTPTPPALEQLTTTTGGVEDGVVHRGKVILAPDGSAKMSLTEEFHGRYAIAVRSALSQVEALGTAADEKRRQLVEQRMIGPKLPGAVVKSLSRLNLDELDAPLHMDLELEVPNFAQRSDRGLLFEAPFLGSMEPLVARPSRETPLYVEESARSTVELSIELPPKARLVSMLEAARVDDPRVRVRVGDRLVKGAFVLERSVDLPAGRVAVDDYASFRDTVRRADRLLNQPIRIEL